MILENVYKLFSIKDKLFYVLECRTIKFDYLFHKRKSLGVHEITLYMYYDDDLC